MEGFRRKLPIRHLSMKEGQTIRFILGEGSPLLSPTLGLVAAALTSGARFSSDKPLLDTVEEKQGMAAREFAWGFDDRSSMVFRPNFREETLSLEELRTRFEDLKWCEQNPDHPIAYMRLMFEKLTQIRTALRDMKPLLKIRQGRSTAFIPADASAEEKVRILAQI